MQIPDKNSPQAKELGEIGLRSFKDDYLPCLGDLACSYCLEVEKLLHPDRPPGITKYFDAPEIGVRAFSPKRKITVLKITPPPPRYHR